MERWGEYRMRLALKPLPQPAQILQREVRCAKWMTFAFWYFSEQYLLHKASIYTSEFSTNKFLFYNSLSCLVSHPDETLRKRLKEKRKGCYYAFIIALCSCTHLNPCLHERAWAMWTLLVHCNWVLIPNHIAPHHWSVKLFKTSKNYDLNKQKIRYTKNLDVFFNVQPGTTAKNVCFVQHEWGMNNVVYSNHSGCSLILLPDVLRQ